MNPLIPSNSSTESDSLLPSYPHHHELVRRADLSKTPAPGSRPPHNPFLQENPPVPLTYAAEHMAPPEPPRLPPRNSSPVPPPVHPIFQYRRRSVSSRTTYSFPALPASAPVCKGSPRLNACAVQARKALHTTKKRENELEQESTGDVLESVY
jgi:hypothetical protein